MTSPAGCAAALAALPGMGPATLVRLLSADDPVGAWGQITAGRVVRPEPRRRTNERPPPSWEEAGRRMDPDELDDACRRGGIEVTWWGDERFPSALSTDPQPPGVLFWRGELSWLEHPCVAIVGTRRATPDGRSTAFELGRDLASAGVCVISGLALGIDGAAHSGALSAAGSGGVGTVGVAASGVDVAYPPRHAGLWEQVVTHGAVCSETPPAQPAEAWRFPSRNRVIAGLSRLVVVVESHAAGGSLLTVEAALARGIDVAAVPGPVRSPASEGTNQLLADGPGPVRHAGDVLDRLGRVEAWPPPGYRQRPQRLPPLRRRPTTPSRPAAGANPAAGVGPLAQEGHPRPERIGPGVLTAATRRVLESVPWRPVSLNRIADECGLGVGAVAASLDELESAGLVACTASWWFRVRTDPSEGHRG